MSIFSNNTGFFQGGKFKMGEGMSNLFKNLGNNFKSNIAGGGCQGGSCQTAPNAPTAQGFTPMMSEEELARLHPEWFPQKEQEGQQAPPPLGIAPGMRATPQQAPPPLGIAPGMRATPQQAPPPLGIAPGMRPTPGFGQRRLK